MKAEELFAEASQSTDSISQGEYRVTGVPDLRRNDRVWLGWSADGRQTAFFEVARTDFDAYTISRAIEINMISASHSTTPGKDLTVMAVKCLNPELGSVFNRFIDDVLDRLGTADAVGVISRAANDWRRLIATASTGISTEKALGIIGELAFLEQLGSHFGPEAIEYWKGPSGHKHDFVGHARSVEMKTATLQSGDKVTIHGLEQLDPPEGADLTLAVVKAELHPSGRSINDLVETLFALGFDSIRLTQLLEAQGYVQGMPGADDVKAVLSTWRFWDVGPGFPALQSSDLRPETVSSVSDVSYALMLGSLPEPAHELDPSTLSAPRQRGN